MNLWLFFHQALLDRKRKRQLIPYAMKRLLSVLLPVICAIIGTSCGNTNREAPTDSSVESPVEVPDPKESSKFEELSNSPRHHQWVTLNSGVREFQALVVYPESKTATKAVLVIHENRGLNDWARLFADKLAAEGFLVIAPDLISNTMGKARTTDFESPDTAREAVYALDPEHVTLALDAAFERIQFDPSSTGEVAVVGFCWGGSQAFRYATHNKQIASTHVFYGTAPEEANALSQISAPVYGYYGEDDNRVNATIGDTEEKMKAANKTFEYEIYEGAGHAFMNRAHEPESSEANKEAHDAAWQRLLSLIKQ